MLYLEQRHFIHRDLGARNILVNDVSEVRTVTVKIGDFGLARDFDFKPGTDVSGNDDDAAAADCSFIFLGLTAVSACFATRAGADHPRTPDGRPVGAQSDRGKRALSRCKRGP